MPRTGFLLLSSTLLLTACGEGRNPLSESAVNAKIDSLVGERTKGLIQQSEEDLDRRLSIEVKAKADSIVAARKAAAPAPVADTSRP